MSAFARSFRRECTGHQILILMTMENIIVGVIAILLFAYLFVAMIRPEKF